ncbi:MAG: helix-turn-helix transcriptional regulator [Chitinophagaceae bacterium]|nr:helix-turn-helix transcriptional regulator [Chitinophagaceae bacterium]
MLQYQIENSTPVTDNKLLVRQSDAFLNLTFHFQGSECGFSFSQSPVSYKLDFQYSKQALKERGFDISQMFSFTEQTETNICCNTQMLLHEVITTRYEGKFKEVFIESKSLELLLCIMHSFAEFKSPCDNCKFLNQPLEKEKILQAREIILQSIHQPPTIPELARQIGINQCYLKKGFKEMFKSTIYEFVIEQRMQKAKLLLSRNQQSVSQIAEEIGYSNTSNFSNAFKKYTGLYPSELSRN